MTPRMSAWHEGHVMGGYQNPKCNECRREQRGPMTTEEYKMVDPVPRPPVDPRTADVERAIAIVNDSRLTHVHWRDWRRSGHGTDEDHEMVGDLTHHEEAIADYDHVLRVLHAYRAALHPVSDATPDLALYDLPALASEPVPATCIGCDFTGNTAAVSYINPKCPVHGTVPATGNPGPYTVRAIPDSPMWLVVNDAGESVLVDAEAQARHVAEALNALPVPATGNPEPCPSCGITGDHSANCADVERFATGNPEEIDVEAYHRRMEHILDDMDANPGASGYTDLIRAAWRESWVARQREGERP